MPPSGYSPPAVIAGFGKAARQCVKDLSREVAEGKHTSLRAGLDFETRKINTALKTPDTERYLRGSVDFIAGVYEKLQSIPGEADPTPAQMEEVLSSIERGLNLLHINEQDEFVERAE